MTVNIKDFQHFTVDDFSGGLNEFASSYNVAKNELVACKNIVLRDSGAIKTRPGWTQAQTQGAGGYYIASDVKGVHRYTSTTGNRDTLLYAGTYTNNTEVTGLIYADNDDEAFSQIGSILSKDGHLRFAQHRDTVLMCTDRDYLRAYNPDHSAEIYPFRIISNYPQIVRTYYELTGGNLKGGIYYYRYTFDYGWGDFMVESDPTGLSTDIYSGGPETKRALEYHTDAAHIVGNEGYTETCKALSTSLPPMVQKINIYRYGPITNTSSLPNPYQDKGDYGYIGSISYDEYEAASVGDVLFTDSGISGDGRRMEYGKMKTPPYGRFIINHKSRIWIANASYEGAVSGYSPARLYFSNINNSGLTEPMGFYEDSWFEVDPVDGYGITGIHSFRNETLIIFKANSIWAITGDSPDSFSLRNVSPEIGCIAPETIQVVDGKLVWLSNGGVYYFDGSVPRPLKTDNISKGIDGIPASRRREACAIYDVHRREYLLAHSGPGTGGYNRLVSRYDLRTDSWARDEYDRGISAFFQKKMPDERVQTFACIGDSPILSISYVIKLNDTHQIGMAGTRTGIPFSFQTPFYDGGHPYMDKDFRAILFDVQSNADLVLDVLVDNKYDSRKDTSFDIKRPSTDNLIWYDSGSPSDQMKWYEEDVNENVWAEVTESGVLVHLNTKCRGKRISLIVSGTVSSEAEIQSATIFYEPLKGVRQ